MLAVLLTALLPGAMADPTYMPMDTARISIPELSTYEMREWVRRVAKERKNTLVVVHEDGVARSVLPREKDALKFRKASEAMITLWLIGMSVPQSDVELDVVVRDGDTLKAGTVWLDAGGRITVSLGSDKPRLTPVTWAELSESYGVVAPDAEERAKFSRRVVGALGQALSLLPPEITAALSDVKYARATEAADVGGHAGAGAAYHRGPGIVYVFDEALKPTAAFVGPVDAPRHTFVRVVLHELGHALADTPWRAGRIEMEQIRVDYEQAVEDDDGPAQDALIARQNALVTELEGLPKDGPLVTAFLEVLGDVDGAPTPYGRTSGNEAFAEAFSLYYTDPAALKRASPQAFAWFEAGHHLPGG